MKNTLRRFAVAGAAVAAFASFAAVNAGAAQASNYEHFASYSSEGDCKATGRHGRSVGDWDLWYCQPSTLPWVWDLYVQPN